MICRYQRQILDQLETILDRDLRQIHDTTLTLPELLRLLRALALRDGRTFNYQELRRATGITPITQNRLLYGLEAVFILRSIPLEGDFAGSAHFFEDQAEVAKYCSLRMPTKPVLSTSERC